MSPFAATQLTAVAAHVGGPTEADWIRWAGLLLAFTGTLAAAPAGVAHLLRSPGSAYQAAWGWVLKVTGVEALIAMVVKAVFAWIGDLMKQAPNVRVSRDMRVDESGADIQIDWDQNAPLKVKVERLHAVLTQVLEQVSVVRQAAESRDADLRARLDRAAAELRAATATLKSRVDAAELDTAKAASRGVILVGIGVILTSIPDGLARIAWIGWLTFAIALFLFCSVTLAIVQEQLASARAHRAAQPSGTSAAPGTSAPTS
jgi:hypothetical protein